MNSSVALATIHHDPGGRLADQVARLAPLLAELFAGMAVQATHATPRHTLDLLGGLGALARQDAPERFAGYLKLGRPRRAAIELALGLGAPFMLFCDFDRLLHWAEYHPNELAHVVERIPDRDFTVLGRTTRAFESHPRVQRDTEAIINHVYALASGQPWDITAAARGLSRRAAEAVVRGCPDESIGTDGSWPLFAQRAGGLTLGYIATEGLEFETADRYAAEVAAAGGIEPWLATLDADPRHWVQRLDMARVEVEALLPYLDLRPSGPAGSRSE